jgi:hypothetical protein
VISGRFVSVVAIIATMTLAACGSGTSSSSSAGQADFKAGFAASQREFRKLGIDLAKGITRAGSKTDAQLAKEFGALADRARHQASELAALKPPARYTKRIASLVAGFRATQADLSKIATAATSHDASSAESATRTLLTDAAKIKTADTSLSRALGLPGVVAGSSASSSASTSTTHTPG